MNLPEQALLTLEELLRNADSVSLKEKLSLVKQAYETLYKEYSKDYLTGLYNRRYFDEMLSASVERAKREDRPFTLLILDLDHFKRINDTFGHAFGDAVLRKVGETIKSNLRKIDFAARYGGEEFAVILPGVGSYAGFRVAQRIKKAIESLEFETPHGKLRPSVSIGGGTYWPSSELGPEEFLKEVDRLLYLAKTMGRSRIEFKSMLEPVSEGLTREERNLLFRREG